MPKTAKFFQNTAITSILCINLIQPVFAKEEADQQGSLEEIIVNAQKVEKSLQETPTAISVLTSSQLEASGIHGLKDLEGGLIPSLRIEPYGSAPSSLVMSIRGFVGSTDPGQATRDTAVAVYKDGFYVGRIQGLAQDHADIERIEVFRGPQGTMFGRNATGGAVNLVSAKPSGEWDFRQSISYGNFDALRSVTSLDLPEFSGIRVKLDYTHSERDGWVENTASDQADYNAYNKDSGGITINADLSDTLTLDYDLDLSQVKATHHYVQLAGDNFGLIGAEPTRVKETRFDVAPLKPTVADHQMHSLSLSWKASDEITIKSLTSFRKLDDTTRTNYAGALYFNGLTFVERLEQEQWTQELQIIGTHDRLEWVAGLYYYDETVDAGKQDSFSLNIDFITGTVTPVNPPTTFNAFTGANVPLVQTMAKTKSKAIYGQATWTPPILDDKLELTFGLRYTDEDRDGRRVIAATTEPFEFKGDHLDPLISAKYSWSDNISTYAKWSTAFTAGGVSIRSVSFAPYDMEKVETFEIGLKSEFLDNRLRVNAALFSTDITDAQIDFLDPVNVTVLETFNAANTVQVDGAEIEVSMVPLPGLIIGLNYTYLDGSMPLQPNPLAGNALTQFNLPQTPEHAGSVTVDYTFPSSSIGTFMAHVDMTATDKYDYVSFGSQELDSYALINARLSLTDIPLGQNGNNLQVSLWGKNLTDAEYVVFGFPLAGIGATEIYGTPRTYGIDLTYKF